MSQSFISPQEALEMMQNGAVLLDIRGADEYARRHIQGAQLSDSVNLQDLPEGSCVIYCCASGVRTQFQANHLRRCAEGCSGVYFLDGGVNAWEKAGFAVDKNAKQPLELMRQVQIVAGSLVFLGVILGYFVAPAFYLLSGFVGAGLIFAGISGFCGLAKLLMLLPWNRT